MQVLQHSSPGEQALVREAGSPSWLHTNLRNVILVSMTLVVCWMAVTGNRDAVVGLMGAFTSLVGFLFGERSALKVPGKDS